MDATARANVRAGALAHAMHTSHVGESKEAILERAKAYEEWVLQFVLAAEEAAETITGALSVN